MSMEMDDLRKIMCSRIARRIHPLRAILGQHANMHFWVAGGALIRDGNDVDLFCPTEWPKIDWSTVEVVSESKNARTVVVGDAVFQFCNYRKPTLDELLKSFDFAHCQVGCDVKVTGSGNFVVDGVRGTDAYINSRWANTSWFTGSEYPLSSLIRIHKYYANGILTKGAAIRSTIDALEAVVRRGFNGYDDFKDQLDAVDYLGLLPDDMENVEKSSLTNLFTLLNKVTVKQHDGSGQ